MGRKRIRAHANPFSDDMAFPASPDEVNWAEHYPGFFASASSSAESGTAAAPVERPRVTIADVGCGFGGLLVALSPLFPDALILGLEIRDRVVELDRQRIARLRSEGSASLSSSVARPAYSNISVVHTNIMKYAPNYFHRGQLSKMFVLFPDPHFKKANHRRRVLATAFLPLYAYCLDIGGMLYTVTDVKELAEWMAARMGESALFERVEEAELKDDPCVEAMMNGTEEGKKVTRLSGNKYPAVWRRVAPKQQQHAEEEQKQSS